MKYDERDRSRRHEDPLLFRSTLEALSCESVGTAQGSKKSPKSGEKRVSGSKNSHFPMPQKRAI